MKSKFSSVMTRAGIAVLLAGVGGTAMADVGYSEAQRLRASGEALPEAQVSEIVGKARPGEITEMELDRDFGRLVYEVEVRDAQGQEWNLEVDGKTGEVLGEERDD